ncbi:hypothetical protein [Burkholderia cepacia]|uniref:hypothetical protein n=1 Tax=Burkholderia cepacia TaxID=292 RepID=UPI00158A93ED|nr:hypothetical protein [Burkholderia cepacia]
MPTSVDQSWADGPSGDALNISESRACVKAWIAACAAIALFHAGFSHAGDTRLFCASATDTFAKDAATRDAVSMIFGRSPAYVPERGPARACIFPVTTLVYPDARVLIMGSVPGEVYPATEAKLSAYFLRSENGVFRLVTVRRDFADGGSGMGNVGKITAIRYGADEGMTIAGDGNGQGYDYGSVALFVFRSDGIASLGTIPTSYSDGGAVDDPAKETQIAGKVEVGQPQPDQVRVVYSIRRNGKAAQQAVVWKLRNGRFVAASGSVPAELRR